MGDPARSPGEIISLPQGGGAIHGLGETFTPDPQTGTGNLTVPLAVPAGRGGLQPSLRLAYSTGSGNGLLGLGWELAVPAIARQTAHGVPRYDDRDAFVLSGAEELVPVERLSPTSVRYRPRTDTLFALIVHHRDPARGQDYWEVTTRDGLVDRFGSVRPAPGDWRDPATLVDPDEPGHTFRWMLTETRDPLGNTITYEYGADEGVAAGHRWRQPLLRAIRYADLPDLPDGARYLATVRMDYEDRPDPFSAYRAGFEVRTSVRCRAIRTSVDTGIELPVRRYELGYDTDPHNGASLLTSVRVVGFDDTGAEHRELPPLTFGYTRFDPAGRRFEPVTGADPPSASLARDDYELADVTGDGLPDVVRLDGQARYWRNLGGGHFDRPRTIGSVPAGVRLSDPGVQLLDADGDGRPDLLVSTAVLAGYAPLRPGATGALRRYRRSPTFSLEDPAVRLADLDGDGRTDALRGGTRLECFLADGDAGWLDAVPARTSDPAGLPAGFGDPRLRLADMTGDGLADLVLLGGGWVDYWPNLGRGRWGARLRMTGALQLPVGADPRLLMLGDVDGDGAADLVLAGAGRITVWINRGGNGWSPPITVPGCPGLAATDALRMCDLLGTGSAGVLWSRDAPPGGRPAMHFLDLVGEVPPRLLDEVDNSLGASTRIGYASSTRYSTVDSERPSTRWRTPLPFVVPVVSTVQTIDSVSGCKVTTHYRYRHGYWDGVDREFRGFGCVEQQDTVTFDSYHGPGLQPGIPFAAVDPSSFTPPTLTRTWFHLGPVETPTRMAGSAAPWVELDCRAEYWPGDPDLLGHRSRVAAFLRGRHSGAGTSDAQARRDALRALRGRVLRSEVYGLDGSTRQGRPYTVTEYAYELREEATSLGPGRPGVFAAVEAARRTTRWERGDDPMTVIVFADDHDAFGRPRRQTTVAPPRRSARRRQLTVAPDRTVTPDRTTVLVTHDRTDFAVPTGTGSQTSAVNDRVAQVRSYELVDPPEVEESDPADVRAVLVDQLRVAEAVRAGFGAPSPAGARLTGHLRHHYDGGAYVGLPAGEVGRYGLPTRSETLVFTAEVLDRAYGPWRPDYLGGSEPLPSGAPAGFGDGLGYRREDGGWWADVSCQAFDTQLPEPGIPARGLVVGTRDPLGHETRVELDRLRLLPAATRNPAGLVTTAEYDYRHGRPRRVVDPNGHATNYRYHPLGMLAAVFLTGRDGEGGTATRPEVRYQYDLGAFAARGQPISVHTIRRVWHASDGVSDETIESREYSDGYGRLVQQRSQAEDLAFGETGDDPGLLVRDSTGSARPEPGRAAGPAVGRRVADRVVVSGWQVYDNKGQVAERYEPFFDAGWDFQPRAEARRGRRIVQFYDPRGQLVRVVNPDGSTRRTVFGVPPDLTDPDRLEPSPWAVTGYDENDLASLSAGPDGTSLTAAAPVGHHFTPTTTIVDARERALCRIVRAGPDPGSDWHAVLTTPDVRGNVLAVVDELGRTTFRHVYDLADRALRVDSADAGIHVEVPDAAGNLAQRRDGRGTLTLRSYDTVNRLATVHARDAPDQALTLREEVTYGDGGRPDQPAGDRAAARAANRLGRTWHRWDEAGMVTVESYSFTGEVAEQVRRVVADEAIAAAEPGGWTADWAAVGARDALDPTEYRTSTSRDALGRATAVHAPADGTGRRALVTATYDRAGAPRSIAVDGVPFVRLLSHDARGQRIMLALGNGLVTRYGHDPDTFRLTRLRTEPMVSTSDTWSGAGAPLQDLTYTYDLVGNVTAIEERTSGCGIAAPAGDRDRLLRTFGYDARYRLVSATGRACADIGRLRPLEDVPRCGTAPTAPSQANAPEVTSGYRESYRYDPAGNLLDLFYETTTGADRPSWHRVFGLGDLAPDRWAGAATNRLTSVRNGSSTTGYGFDAGGNLESEGEERRYTWDHAGRLTGFRVSNGVGTSVAVRYLYDADGMRVKKWVRRGDTPSLDRSTVYIGRIVEHHRWEQGGGGEHRLLHVLDGAARVALIRTGTPHPHDTGPPVRYELGDHLGSAAVSVDAAGSWLTREEYFPYGETSFGGFRRKRYRFAGKERDEETGLGYHSARYYAAPLGRWISPDPAGRVDSANLYQALKANPMRFTDARGTQSAPVDQTAQPQAGATATADNAGTGAAAPWWRFSSMPLGYDARTFAHPILLPVNEYETGSVPLNVVWFFLHGVRNAGSIVLNNVGALFELPEQGLRSAGASEATIEGLNFAGVMLGTQEIAALPRLPAALRASLLEAEEATAALAKSEEFITLFHGTSSNRAARILREGFRTFEAVFFAEDFETAANFARNSPVQPGQMVPRSHTILEFRIPASLVEDLELSTQHVIGEYRGDRFVQLGASPYERILFEEYIAQFNEAMQNGLIQIRRLRPFGGQGLPPGG